LLCKEAKKAIQSPRPDPWLYEEIANPLTAPRQALMMSGEIENIVNELDELVKAAKLNDAELLVSDNPSLYTPQQIQSRDVLRKLRDDIKSAESKLNQLPDSDSDSERPLRDNREQDLLYITEVPLNQNGIPIYSVPVDGSGITVYGKFDVSNLPTRTVEAIIQAFYDAHPEMRPFEQGGRSNTCLMREIKFREPVEPGLPILRIAPGASQDDQAPMASDGSRSTTASSSDNHGPLSDGQVMLYPDRVSSREVRTEFHL
jgi:hypothetical protein